VNDVTIPADLAKAYAVWLRRIAVDGQDDHRTLADLLDPKPPTLREQVAVAMDYCWENTGATRQQDADSVLAVVADWLAAQPVVPNCGSSVDGDGCFVKDQRAADVRLLRGES